MVSKNIKLQYSADRIVKLLAKRHIGTLDAHEQADLDVWLEADEKNRDLYHRLCDNKYLREQYVIYKDCENQDGWEELSRRMSATPKRKVFFRNIARWGSAAAVAAIIIVTLFRVDWSGEQSAAGLLVNQIQYVVPGRNEAVVELRTGEKIVLNDKQAHSVKMLSDIGVISGDSMLRYDVIPRNSFVKIPDKHTFRVPKGATTKIVVLSDGTRVWLNAGSSITYPVQFSGNERTVGINGECYFDVAHDQDKPFVVETNDIEIRVMGTQFNVMSYPDDMNVETTLISGLVSISASNKEVILKPGVQAIYNKESSDISLRDIDTRIFSAWKEGVFEFNNMTVENICHVLGRWYDIEFIFDDYKVRSMLFNGTLKRDKTLAFILDRISETKTINYKMEEGKVIIMRK